jgi:hypothetical protein
VPLPGRFTGTRPFLFWEILLADTVVSSNWPEAQNTPPNSKLAQYH